MKKQDYQGYKERTKEHFEEISTHYSDTYAGRYTGPMHDAVIQELEGKHFQTLLDVGCGTGIFLSMVLDRFDSRVRVSGIDLSPGMIEQSRELLGGRADLKVGDSDRLPWEGESFDMVTCIASFHHYPDPQQVLGEMRRVLSPGGSVIIADPWAPEPFRFIANLIIKTPLNKGGDLRVYSHAEIWELMERSGLVPAKWETKGSGLARYFVATAVRR